MLVFRIDKGGSGAQKQKKFLKNETKWKFFLIFLLFRKAP